MTRAQLINPLIQFGKANFELVIIDIDEEGNDFEVIRHMVSFEEATTDAQIRDFVNERYNVSEIRIDRPVPIEEVSE